MTRPRFSSKQLSTAIQIIKDAEADLGSLTRGQLTDLLLDNMPILHGCEEARILVDEARMLIEAECRHEDVEVLTPDVNIPDDRFYGRCRECGLTGLFELEENI